MNLGDTILPRVSGFSVLRKDFTNKQQSKARMNPGVIRLIRDIDGNLYLL